MLAKLCRRPDCMTSCCRSTSALLKSIVGDTLTMRCHPLCWHSWQPGTKAPRRLASHWVSLSQYMLTTGPAPAALEAG